MLELLSPAGNIEKLRTAINYGADACYMGLKDFSLRANAGNFGEKELEEVRRIKEESGKKLYCTMNIIFKEDQIEKLYSMKDEIASWPFDAFIISDIGLVDFFKKYLPDKDLHLSTQASCINSNSVKAYRDMGFKRVILGREASLDSIKRIKDKVPEMELECFVHGAMCMAYSGRCILSSYLTGRSANQGDCAHTCRWNYRMYAIEEEERKGQYMPIEGGDDYTAILSSKDLCMIDHVDELRDAGLDSLKIEGRMKSVYYVAVVTRAYRKAIDNDADKDKFKITAHYYDAYGNLVQSRTRHVSGDYEMTYIQCDLLGNILQSYVEHLDPQGELLVSEHTENTRNICNPGFAVVQKDSVMDTRQGFQRHPHGRARHHLQLSLLRPAFP